jgi:positive regulator of sigma E activity
VFAVKGEDIYEDGIVLRSEEGKATIAVMGSDSCHDCGAKVFCSASDGKENTVEVHDPLGAHAGDTVRFVIRGEIMFKAAGMLYGVPLILIIAGVLVGTYLFDPGIMPRELWSFILGIGAAGFYYLIFFLSGSGAHSGSMMPSIVQIKGPAAT